MPCDEGFVLLRGVDAVVAGDGLDDGDGVAVLEGAELFELFGNFAGGFFEGDVGQQELAPVGVEAWVFQRCDASAVAIVRDQ